MIAKFSNIFLLLLTYSNSFSQIQPTVSNLFRYGDGKQSIGSNENTFVYRENLTDVKFLFPQNFSVGFRLLYDNPPEVGQIFTGLNRRFIEYSNNGLNLRAGNYSELYGKGMVINLFENRGLAYDTWFDGLRTNYKFENLDASLLYGTMTFVDSINFWREEEYVVVGGNLEYSFSNNFSLGISYVSSEGKIPLPDITYNLSAELPEIYLTLNISDFEFYANWSEKKTNTKNFQDANGNGIYSYLSYTTSGLGIIIDYKNYRSDERNPFEKYDYTRPTRMLPFQNPPIVMKEHSYLFLSRSIHEIDFNDEVGLQAELFYSISDELNLNINGSLASRHNFYEYQSSESPNPFTFVKIKRSRNFLPSIDNKYSPYWEFLVDSEFAPNFFTTFHLGFAQRTKVTYNYFTGNNGTHIIKSTIVPLLIDHIFSRTFSSSLQYEFESVNDNFNTPQEKFTNHYLALNGTYISKITLGFRFEITTNNHDLSGRKDWFTIDLGVRINQSNTLSVSYGKERGGQACTNGICRYVLPFSGFKFNLLSTFN